MKRLKPGEDPLERIREWQDHRYDPGYFTGGRIDPLLTGGRPNRYGWVLLIIGTAFGAVFLVADFSDLQWWQRILAWAYVLLLVTAGVKLLRRKGRKTARHGR